MAPSSSLSASGQPERSNSPPSPRTSPFIAVLIAIATVLVVAAALYFLRNTDEADSERAFSAYWLLDDESRAWMERTCVDLAFADTIVAAVMIDVNDDRAVVRFNDVKQTRFVGSLGTRQLSVRQFVQTSDVGRFCGEQTTLDISWRVTKDRPDELLGRWATPGCEICPTRRFRALRSDASPDDPR